MRGHLNIKFVTYNSYTFHDLSAAVRTAVFT